MKYVIGMCPFLGDYDFCTQNGKDCKDATCLLREVLNDCIKYKGSNALQEIIFRTMDVCEVTDD